MKTNRKYSALIAAVILVAIDVVTFTLTKKADFNPQFWLGFAFIQASFLAYILTKLLLKTTDADRGIVPLDTILIMIIAVMVLMGLISYLAPYDQGIFKTMICFYIIVSALGISVCILASLNKKVIEENTIVKPRVFEQNDLVRVLEEIKNLTKDAVLEEQVQIVIDQVNGIEIDVKSLKGKQLVEYCQFMYKNATRQEVDNLYNNLNKVKEILEEIK